MKKKLIILSAILATSMLMVSCVNNNYDPSNDSGKTDNSSNSLDNESNKSDSNDNSTDNKENTDSEKNSNNTDNSNKEENKDDSKEDINAEQSKKQKLLNDINEKAKLGKVLNSDYAVEKSVIDDIIKELGAEDNSEYVEAAKGRYFTFEDENVVFGCNKGSQVFEVRSFDESLNSLTVKDVTGFYGEPEYDVTTSSDERIIGYTISSELKIEFVLQAGGTNSAKVDHYNILWPRGTVNLMSGDEGREW